ncbi:MAG: sialidase family protein [Bryobacteraceae bacterium]
MRTKTSRRSFLVSSVGSALLLRADQEKRVQSIRTPNGGLQPQAVVDSKGAIHLIYLYGDPAAADIGYVRKSPLDQAFSAPIRVNSHPGSAIAIGTVRGAPLALGKSNRIHVAWNGSSNAEPKGPRNSAPMLYTRLNNRNDGFEPERNVMTTASGLDGGGTLAADSQGNVFVAWHAQGQQNSQPIEGEGHRRVWLARSTDEGRSFDQETPVSPGGLGACGCCGMSALADRDGNLYLLYRSARETIHRDMYLLTSRDRGMAFQAVNLHPWQIGACPMSTVSLALGNGRVLLSWETEKQVYFAAINIRAGGHRQACGCTRCSQQSQASRYCHQPERSNAARLDGRHGMEKRGLARMADLR